MEGTEDCQQSIRAATMTTTTTMMPTMAMVTEHQRELMTATEDQIMTAEMGAAETTTADMTIVQEATTEAIEALSLKVQMTKWMASFAVIKDLIKATDAQKQQRSCPQQQEKNIKMEQI